MLANLVPIIEALQRQDPNAGNPPLTPPSPEKLEKNALSEESGSFAPHPSVAARQALSKPSFARARVLILVSVSQRRSYALRGVEGPRSSGRYDLQAPARLCRDERRAEAPRRGARRSPPYFFDSCDIFEDPVASAEAS